MTVGGALMYLLDPDRGRRRRALVRDQIESFRRRAADAVEATARDARNRAYGLAAEARAALERGPVPEHVLAQRVREKLGHWVSHPRAIRVSAEGGCVRLEGPILADEVEGLLAAVRRMRGVEHVQNALDVHARGDGFAALQGGTPPRGERSAPFQDRWAPALRGLGGAAGVALALAGLRRGGIVGALLNMGGAALTGRSVTNRPLGMARPSSRAAS